MAVRFSGLDKDVKTRIIKAANTIRKKYLAYKLERSEEDEALNQFLNPIADPLKKLVENTKKHPKTPKPLEAKRRRSFELSPIKHESTFLEPAQFKKPFAREEQPGPSFVRSEVIATTTDDSDDEVFLKNSSGENSGSHSRETMEKTMLNNPEVYREFLEQYPEISHDYLEKFWTKSDEIASNSGITYDSALSKFKIGAAPLDFTTEGIVVDGKQYRGTPGLYELMFYEKPKNFDGMDTANYRDILDRANLTRNIPKVRTRSNPNFGYRKSSRIAKAKSTSGKALVEYTEKPKEYVYYNDVNELVNRFRKLEASAETGNNNNTNEIINILKELESLGVIEFY
jgi:hypothetical protein